MCRISLFAILTLSLTLFGCDERALDDEVLIPEPAYEEGPGKADSGFQIELKLMLAQNETNPALETFGFTKSNGAAVDIYFFETPERTLFGEGLILRSRYKHGKEEDSTVKWRPMTIEDVEEEFLAQEGFKCELDRGPQQEVSSCSFTVIQDDGELDDVLAGTRSVEKLFSRSQEDFAARYMPEDLFTWDDLVSLGPIETLKWRVTTKHVDSRLTFELWTLPDGEQMLEVSTKVAPHLADETQKQMHAFIERKGLRTDGVQLTKTKLAMDAL